MINDSTPVSDGQMVGVIDTSTSPVTATVYIRNSSQTQDSNKNENGYTFFCNLSDATVIQGPKGDKGNTGDKGDTPVITITTVSATPSTPEGKKITFTTGTGPTATSVSTTIYNGINLKTASFNASNELILTLTDGSTINLGVLPGTSGSNTSYITILGCYDNTNIPTTCNVGDVYFNTTDNLLYKCSTINTWDAVGSTPTNTDIYISLNDRNLYTYADNTWESYGGGNWIDIDITNKNDFQTKAYNLSQLSTIPVTDWKLYMSKKLRFAFCITQYNSNNGILLKCVKYIADLTASWRHSTEDQAMYEYISDTELKVTFLKEGNYKVNYLDELISSNS